MAKEEKNVFENVAELPVNMAMLDPGGRIVAVNAGWKSFGRSNGLQLQNAGVGEDYLRHCQTSLAKTLKMLLARRRKLVTLIYPCHTNGQDRWFFLIGLPLSLERESGLALLHLDITDLFSHLFGRREIPGKMQRRAAASRTSALNTFGDVLERATLNAVSDQLGAMFCARRISVAPKGAGQARPSKTAALAKLSERERTVLRLLGEGKTNKEIARTLFRSPNTIKLHVSAILEKLDMKSRTQAALLASQIYGD
jgi:DNA-binding CsgD family transcriptional regulator